MAKTLKLDEDSGVGKVVLKFEADTDLTLEHPKVAAVWTAMMAMHRAVVLSSARWFHKNTDPVETFTYSFTALDGRKWEQKVLTAVGDLNPKMSWNVADWWRNETEVAFHRELRKAIIALHASHGCTDVKFDFTPV